MARAMRAELARPSDAKRSENNGSVLGPVAGCEHRGSEVGHVRMAVDFDAVRRNAADQGLILQEIAIMYEGLTDEEVQTLTERGLVGVALERPGALLGKFTSDGEALFPHKAVGIHYLGA